MAANVRVRVLFNRIPDLEGRARQRGGQITRAHALAIKQRARALVPVDTGALQASIEATKLGPFDWEVTAGSDGVDYAAYVEFGTYRMAPQPYLLPAAEADRGDFVRDMEGLIE